MNVPETTEYRKAVALSDMMSKIKRTVYTVLPDTTTTVCQIFMENGYVVLGTSACVDPNNFSAATGEKYAFEDAVNKLWPLEGYLLAEEIYQRSKA
jgi:hypothetical protein